MSWGKKKLLFLFFDKSVLQRSAFLVEFLGSRPSSAVVARFCRFNVGLLSFVSDEQDRVFMRIVSDWKARKTSSDVPSVRSRARILKK